MRSAGDLESLSRAVPDGRLRCLLTEKQDRLRGKLCTEKLDMHALPRPQVDNTDHELVLYNVVRMTENALVLFEEYSIQVSEFAENMVGSRRAKGRVAKNTNNANWPNAPGMTLE